MAAVQENVGADTLLLRATEAAEEWIAQFDPTDRQYASLLLESLELVPTAKLERALAMLVAAEVAGVQTGSVALFAVREIAGRKEPIKDAPAVAPEAEQEAAAEKETKTSVDCLPSDGSKQLEETKATAPRRRLRRAPTPPYFHPNAQKVRPDAVAPGGGVGSEGDIAHLIRDLAKQHGNKVLDHPSIHAMKETRCRLLLLIDDLIGSGTRGVNFLRAVVSNRTIKSWYSFGYIKIRVLAYAATSAGLARVEAERRQDGVRYERLVGKGSSHWSDAQREEITRICAKYWERTSRRTMPLGYKRAFTTIVFEHKCPNTNPPILWAGASSWKALFEDRPKLGFPLWPVAAPPTGQEQRILKAIGQQRLANVNWTRLIDPGARLRMLVLAAVARKLRHPEAIAALVQVSIPLAKQLLNECARAGWATWTYHLTPAGNQELQHARAVGIVGGEDGGEQQPLLLKSSFYFPKALRRAGKPT